MRMKEIARKFGRTSEWVGKLINLGFIPKAVKHEIDFEAAAIGIFTWQEQRLKAAEGARAELARSRAGVAAEDIAWKQQRRMIQAKDLLPRAGVEAVWFARKMAMRDIVTQSGLSKKEQDAVLAEFDVDVDEYLNKGK